MSKSASALERAFELARSGHYADVTAIRKQMRSEGRDLAQLTGPMLIKQLRAICAQSSAERDSQEGSSAAAP